MYIRTSTMSNNERMLSYVMDNQSKYYDLAKQASSGKKLTEPSDDPSAAKNVLNANVKISQLNNYLNNMSLAQNELNVLDDALSSLTDSLQQANDLATQAANGTYSQDDLNNFKIQIDQVLENVLDLTNTQYNGNYIFSGTATSTETYRTDADGSIVYQGNNGLRKVIISDGISSDINAIGSQVFGSYDGATGVGTGIIGTLKELSNALGSGNQAEVSASLDKFSNNLDTISVNRTKFASVTSRFEMTQSSINTNITNLKSYKSSLEDADLTEVLSSLAIQQTALQATMSVTSQTLSRTSLLDYM